MARIKRIYTVKELRAMIVVMHMAMWLVGKIVIRSLSPGYVFRAYIIIPIVFLIFSFAATGFMAAWDKKVLSGAMTIAKALNNFMITKIVKLFVSLTIVFCCFKFVISNEDRIPFLLTFSAFYLVFTAWEAFAMHSFMQRHKVAAKAAEREQI